MFIVVIVNWKNTVKISQSSPQSSAAAVFLRHVPWLTGFHWCLTVKRECAVFLFQQLSHCCWQHGVCGWHTIWQPESVSVSQLGQQGCAVERCRCWRGSAVDWCSLHAWHRGRRYLCTVVAAWWCASWHCGCTAVLEGQRVDWTGSRLSTLICIKLTWTYFRSETQSRYFSNIPV